ncbi:MAG TPA: CDP-glucose 4,6-dehydratase [Polyangia bacterium]|nr:CDP-glucose 4,6-dehydratase [Polyangia bacterium]
MEDLGVTNLGATDSFWKGRRVFLTGHTGFKGGWLAVMLERLGAVVTGYSLAPEGDRTLFASARVDRHAKSIIADIRDLSVLRAAVSAAAPEVVLHLAAQALVLTSYERPLDTFSTNVVGTANVLEAARETSSVRAVVVVTSDKVYKNREWAWGYRENDELGGRDPYSSSKACTELVAASYRDSFLAARGVALATARAGNVIGGGDWAANRIVPDFVRATIAGEPLRVRNPASTRPWQHVLEPIEGYLVLARRLLEDPKAYATGWNFGPPPDAVQPVRRLADDLVAAWGDGASWRAETVDQPHEAGLLTLDATKARRELSWTPRLGYERGVRATVDWYRAYARGADCEAKTIEQVDAYLDPQS